MRVIPSQSILINGQHCEAGQPIEVADTLGRVLIAERQAKPAPAEIPAVEAAAVEAPAVEAATAVAAPKKKNR